MLTAAEFLHPGIPGEKSTLFRQVEPVLSPHVGVSKSV